MTPTKRREILRQVVFDNLGKPCPCCLEKDEFRNLGLEGQLLDTVKLFQKVFGVSVIGPNAVTAFRLVPVPAGIAKRGEDFFYLKENLFPSCCDECRIEYQNMWLRHPERVSFIEELVGIQQRSKATLKRR